MTEPTHALEAEERTGLGAAEVAELRRRSEVTESQAHEERLAMIHSARDGAYMLALVGASVALALTSHGELAATALGGALALAVPRGASVPRVPALALGLMFGAFVGLAG